MDLHLPSNFILALVVKLLRKLRTRVKMCWCVTAFYAIQSKFPDFPQTVSGDKFPNCRAWQIRFFHSFFVSSSTLHRLLSIDICDWYMNCTYNHLFLPFFCIICSHQAIITLQTWERVTTIPCTTWITMSFSPHRQEICPTFPPTSWLRVPRSLGTMSTVTQLTQLSLDFKCMGEKFFFMNFNWISIKNIWHFGKLHFVIIICTAAAYVGMLVQ